MGTDSQTEGYTAREERSYQLRHKTPSIKV